MTVPDRLPILSAGAHLSPEDGGCFMEIASLLAGEPWSDHPQCTHPVLASVARSVNDEISARSRGDLFPLVPAVIGVVGANPAIAPALVRRVTETAQEFLPRSKVLRRHRSRAESRLEHLDRTGGGFPERLRAWLYERGAAMHAIRCAVLSTRSLERGRRDAALRSMLMASIEEARNRCGASAPAETQAPSEAEAATKR